ncbi:toxin HicA [Nocardia nova]|nr:toxin HicA [Nocardia nova]
MAANPSNVRFADLLTVCEHHFGSYRQRGGHYVFSMPWPGDPRVNIQAGGAQAKSYQVRQVLAAIAKKEAW